MGYLMNQMGAEQQAFMAAILAAADDDAPRLIYADWLDEHGESDLAEFIRVQCELSSAARRGEPYEWDDPLRTREKLLVRGNRDRWLAGLPDQWAYRFVRGFPHRVTARADRQPSHRGRSGAALGRFGSVCEFSDGRRVWSEGREAWEQSGRPAPRPSARGTSASRPERRTTSRRRDPNT